MVLRQLAVHVLWLDDKEKKNNDAHSGDDRSRRHKRPAPRVCAVPDSRNDRSKNVAHRRVSVPYAHDKTSIAFAKPVAHHRHHARPARWLCYATEELHEDEVGEAVDVRPERHTEGHGEQSAQRHSGEQQVAQTDAIAEMSHEEHGDGISEQESEVHIAQSRVIVKRQPSAVGFARVRVLSEGWRADAVEASPIKFGIIAVVVCLLVPCAVVRVPGRLHNTDGLSRQMVSGIAAER